MSEDDLNDNERLLLLRSIKDRSIHNGDPRPITLSDDEIKALIWGKNVLVNNEGQRILLRAFMERITKTNVRKTPGGWHDGGRVFDVMSRFERGALDNAIFWASSDYVNRREGPDVVENQENMDDEVFECYKKNFHHIDCKTRGPTKGPCAQYKLCYETASDEIPEDS